MQRGALCSDLPSPALEREPSGQRDRWTVDRLQAGSYCTVQGGEGPGQTLAQGIRGLDTLKHFGDQDNISGKELERRKLPAVR